MSQPASKDIASSIHITIMRSATITRPSSLIQTRLASRPGYASAYVAGLGGESFADFFNLCPVPDGLVAEHVSKAGPACVENGFSQAGLGESGGVDVTHRDVIEPFDEVRRKFVLKVRTPVCDLGVDRLDPSLLVGALGNRKISLGVSIEALRVDNFAVTERCETFQPKVDADGSRNRSCRSFRHINRQVDVPVSFAVLRKRPVANFPLRQFARQKHAECASVEPEGVALALDVAPLEWHPSEGLLSAPAQEWALVLRARLCVLLANRVDRAGMQAKFLAATRSELVQIESGRPFLSPLERLLLYIVGVVPDIAACAALLVQQAVEGLDPVAKYCNHGRHHNPVCETMQEFNRGRHSVSKLVVHLVFVTKYRRRLLDAQAIEFLAAQFKKCCEKLSCDLIAADGEADHIHAMVSYPPKLSVSVIVNALKGSSSYTLRRCRKDIASRYWRGVLWSPSYFAVSVGGAPLAVVKAYVENQRQESEASPPSSTSSA